MQASRTDRVALAYRVSNVIPGALASTLNVPEAVDGGEQTEELGQRLYGEPPVGVNSQCSIEPFVLAVNSVMSFCSTSSDAGEMDTSSSNGSPSPPPLPLPHSLHHQLLSMYQLELDPTSHVTDQVDPG